MFVVDVGNTQIKIASYHNGVLSPPIYCNHLPESWEQLPLNQSIWTIAGSAPAVVSRFAAWLQERGESTRIINHWTQIGLQLDVDFPEKVGIDRLLTAKGALSQLNNEAAAIIVNAGTAVTIDVVTSDNIFHGGAIMPGLRLMAKALNDYTELLPLIDHAQPPINSPGRNTDEAIRLGVFSAVIGGIERLIEEYRRRWPIAKLFVTGGDMLGGLAEWRASFREAIYSTTLTLEGLAAVAIE